MAESRALNRSNTLYAQTGRGAPDIAMPSIEEMQRMNQADGNSSQGNFFQGNYNEQSVSENKQVFSVPDTLPEEVAQEMQSTTIENNDVSEPIPQTEAEEKVSEKEISVKNIQSNDSVRDNLVKLRQAKEKAERERDELMQYFLKNQQQSQQHSDTTVKPKESEHALEFDIAINDDDLVEGKVVKQILSKVQQVESHLKNYQNQSNQLSVESKIRAQFPDFERVVSQENVELLNYQYPEVAASLRDTQDIYSKAAAAYKIMKTFGIYKDHQSQELEMAKKNINKPRPATSVAPQQGDSPLSKANAFANGLTKEMKEQLLKEMYQSRKGI